MCACTSILIKGRGQTTSIHNGVHCEAAGAATIETRLASIFTIKRERTIIITIIIDKSSHSYRKKKKLVCYTCLHMTQRSTALTLIRGETVSFLNKEIKIIINIQRTQNVSSSTSCTVSPTGASTGTGLKKKTLRGKARIPVILCDY